MSEKFSLRNLVEFRERTISSYIALPDRFRFAGMDRDLTEEEKTSFARLEAAVLTLQALDPSIVNVDALKCALNETTIVLHQYGSVFDE